MRSLDNLEFLYESIIINEMNQNVIDYITDHEDQLLGLDSIFGDKMRIAIPLSDDSGIISDMMSDIKHIKDYAGFDPKTNEVIRKIKLDPKYGQGSEKEQRIQLGKAISSLKIPEEKKKKYLNWFAKHKDHIDSSLTDDSDYGIILSRAPVDIVRMSDHRNISSCHSQTGSYFKCAVQEAITGGAVAYLVHKDMIEQLIKTDSLQDEEIFPDRERDVDGWEPPLARMRIRRLEDQVNGTDIGIPELRVYGDSNIPGFAAAVTKYLQSKQNLDPEAIKDSIRNGDLKSRGGTYHDSNIPDMLNSYFKMSSMEGFRPSTHNVNHHYDDDAGEENYLRNGGRNVEEQFDEITHRYNRRADHSGVNHYHVEGNYYSVVGDTTFEFPDGLEWVYDDFHALVEDPYDIAKFIKKKNEDPRAALVAYIEELYGDEFAVSRIEFNINYLVISVQPESENLIDDPDMYQSFCDDVYSHIEVTHTVNLKKILWFLSKLGVVERGNEYSRVYQMETSEENLDWWTFFEIYGDDKSEYEAKSESMDLFKTIKDIYLSESFLKRMGTTTIFAFKNFIVDNFKPTSNNNSSEEQMSFKSFTESTSEKLRYIIQGLPMDVKYSYHQGILTLDFIKIGKNDWTDTAFEIVDFLDKYYTTDIKNIAICTAYISGQFTDSVDPTVHAKLKQLLRLYKPYFKYINADTIQSLL